MKCPFLARVLCAVIFPCLVGCETIPTTLRVDSDPAGADVNDSKLNFIGTTPLPLKLTKKDLKALGAGSRVSMKLTLSKRGYVSVTVPVTWETGTHRIVKQNLQERLDQVEITTEPVGVGIFLLVLDASASAADQTAFKADPLTFYKGAPAGPGTAALPGHPQSVTQRFLGSTPTSYIYDPDNALENNDPLLFQKEGYQDQIVLFKVAQLRVHRIMKKLP